LSAARLAFYATVGNGFPGFPLQDAFHGDATRHGPGRSPCASFRTSFGSRPL